MYTNDPGSMFLYRLIGERSYCLDLEEQALSRGRGDFDAEDRFHAFLATATLSSTGEEVLHFPHAKNRGGYLSDFLDGQ